MAQTGNLVDTTKKMVRAVLLSAPHGLSIRDMLKDYGQLVMEPLPYKSLGFQTPQEYFESIADAVDLFWYRGELMVRGVADQTTEHIARMVANQRSSKKRRSRPVRSNNYPRPIPPRFSPRDLPPRFQKSNTVNPAKFKDHTREPQPLKKSNRNSVTQPLESNSQLCDFGGASNLIRDENSLKKCAQNVPRQNCAKPVPKTNKGTMQELPVVQNQPNREPAVPNFVQREITELLCAYPDGIVGSCFNTAFGRRFGQQLNFSQFGFASLMGLLRSIPDVVSIEKCEKQYGVYRIYSTLKKLDSKTSKRSPLLISPPASSRLTDKNCEAASPKLKKEKSTGKCLSPNKNSHGQINDELKEQICQVLAARPRGIFCARFPLEYKAMFGCELPVMRLGFVSVIEMMSSLRDIAVIDRPSSTGDWILYSKPQGQQSYATDKNNNSAQKIDLHLTIRKILAAHPMGIVMSDLPVYFKRLTGQHLKALDFGFVSLDNLVVNLADKHLRMEYSGAGIIKIFPLGQLLEDKKSTLSSESETSTVSKENSLLLPPDSVGPGVYYQLQVIPALDQSDTYIEVYVSNIANPSHLWIQLKGTNTTDELETLMDDLDIFYNNPVNNEKYRMPTSMIAVGQLCAAIFPEDSNWHRCVITHIYDQNESMIEVYYVDYGNRCGVPLDMIRILKSRFIELPCQAIEGRLANIVPVDKKWMLPARDRLLSLCTNRCVCALVTDVQNRVLSLCLCDTSGDEDIHINDVLVNEGLAKFSPDNMTPTKVIQDLHTLAETLEPVTEDEATSAMGIESVDGVDMAQQQLNFDEPADEELEQIPRFIKLVQCVDNDIHLVNYGGTAYLLSAEISRWLWDANVLKEKLRAKRMVISKVSVNKTDDPELYEEFTHYGIESVLAENETTLYELRCVPRILDAFKCLSLELMKAVRTLYEEFDADEIYWQGNELENDEEELIECVDEEEVGNEPVEFGIEELHLMLKAMQFRRKRLLMEMQQGSVTASVDAMKAVEIQMSKLKEKICHLEGKENIQNGEPFHDRGDNLSMPADVFIHKCIGDQYRASGDQMNDKQVLKEPASIPANKPVSKDLNKIILSPPGGLKRSHPPTAQEIYHHMQHGLIATDNLGSTHNRDVKSINLVHPMPQKLSADPGMGQYGPPYSFPVLTAEQQQQVINQQLSQMMLSQTFSNFNAPSPGAVLSQMPGMNLMGMNIPPMSFGRGQNCYMPDMSKLMFANLGGLPKQMNNQ